MFFRFGVQELLHSSRFPNGSEVGRAEECMPRKRRPLSRRVRATKLLKLAELLGFKTIDEMFDAAVTDTACPGICVNPWCEYIATVAPDERAGYCQRDGSNTVQSALVLAGLM
jgi:hypothetical protein